MKYFSSLKLKLIYVFRINDADHEGCLKIGEATCNEENVIGLTPNSKPLNEAARKRINQYTQTAGIRYELLHTELALYNRGGLQSFNDKEVHAVLECSGVKKKVFDKVKGANEWFITDLETAKNAIAAVKEGRESLLPGEVTHKQSPIIFRPEQQEAIDKTERKFRKGNQMLWNAKMRFGKTLSALQVVKDMDFRRTLILTHRPAVNAGWFDDFGKIFYESDTPFSYGSKENAVGKRLGESFANLERRAKANGLHYLYFASMQDLRGSELVGGNFDKNDEVFATPWDLIIVDEAHEGTRTELGEAVMAELVKKNTKVLRLSGTPFNLLDDFKEDEIYTWDYVMEQRAKLEWDKEHPGDPNPYAALPAMNIYTYDLGRLLRDFADEDLAFNFREFFRVNGEGSFIHERDVSVFLNLLTKEDEDSCYPFASEEYRDIFRHTLWMLPGVKEAKALSALLQRHPVFQHFTIVNVAGDGDEDEESRDALEAVKSAIGKDPEATRTITLSCGRLTTGVSVPAWTAVLMLAGSYNTAASSYMQTIFRVQTPATINGRVKEQCYVFDFAPDRTLRVLAETAKISAKAGKTSQDDRKTMGDFLNFCPVIAIEGSRMDKFDVPRMLEQLKRVYVERVVRNGFEDNSLYNDELLRLDDVELQEFDKLKKIIGQTKAMPKAGQVDINSQGLNNEEYEEKEKLEKKPKKGLSEEEKRRLEELKKKTKNREAAISILRGISIRMPLLIYGAELDNEDEEITIDNFAEKIDDRSWEEFMPKGVNKQQFNAFKKYYDPDIFRAAGKRIRAMARAADRLSVEERIGRITDIFSTFRNPDKETVLTPWRVVNMHLGDCLGGYNFFDEAYEHTLDEPRFVDHGKVTAEVFTPDARILEINSKSGLYPLYMAYGIYRARLKDSILSADTLEEQQAVWDKVVAENIFVVCKTPMAKSITKRTLVGFRKAKVNTRYFEDLINQIKNKPQNFIEKMPKGHSFWKANDDDNMKFNAIVGNPPYQVTTERTSDIPVYNYFMDVSFKISDKVSLITPARYLFDAGKTPHEWNLKVLNDEHFKVIWYKAKSTDVFPNVDIKGGVAVCFRDAKQLFGKIGSFTAYQELNGIYSKVVETNEIYSPLSNIIYPQNKFNLTALYGAYPNLRSKIGSNGNERRLTTSIFGLKEIFHLSKEDDNDIKILGLIKNTREIRWINSTFVEEHPCLGKWKVIVPKSNGTGAIGEILSTPLIGEPLIGYTQSFIGVGAFESQVEAMALLKYIKTKFARTLLGILKVTQDNSKETWRFVPLQDFTEHSDIDWNRPIPEIDQQLYAKYHLTDEEIEFIEKMIKPM